MFECQGSCVSGRPVKSGAALTSDIVDKEVQGEAGGAEGARRGGGIQGSSMSVSLGQSGQRLRDMLYEEQQDGQKRPGELYVRQAGQC